MYCNECGTKMPDDSKFCSKCGNAFEGTTNMSIEPIQTGITCPNCKSNKIKLSLRAILL